MDASQPSFYHIGDPLQNLNLQVTLKCVHGGKVKKEEEGGGVESKAKAQKTLTSRVTWQEKIFGPREIAVMAPTQSDRDTLGSPRTPRNAKSGLGPAGANSTVADSDYQEQLYQRVRDGADPLDDLDTAMIFTYVDKDGFVPKSAMRPSVSTSKSGNDPDRNPLGLARATQPMRQLGATVLPDASKKIKKHLTRETGFRIMYIMAGVDVMVDEVKEGSLQGDSEKIFGGPMTSGGPRFYEKILCTIKLYNNDTMECTPGLSTEEPEDQHNPTFASSHSLNVRQTDGAKLTTFRFVTPRGTVYEYAIANLNEVDNVTTIEKLTVEEEGRDKRKVMERRNRHGSFFFGQPTGDVPFFLHANVEIVSAVGFEDEGGYLFAEYELDQPNGWSFATQCAGIHWGGRDPPDERSGNGSTQMARPFYPRPKKWGGEGVAFGTHGIPTGSDLVEGARGRFMACVCFLLVVGGMLLGEGYMLWLFGAIFMAGAVMGVSPSGQYNHEVVQPTYHFGHPFNLHLAAPSNYHTDPIAMSGKPTLLFQLSSKHSFQRHVVEGYGYVKVPTQPGTYDMAVKCWVPRGGIRSEMRNFFIGGAYRLHDLRSVEMPPDMGGASFLSKFGFRTERSGTLNIRINVVAAGKPPAKSEDEEAAMENTMSRTGVGSSIDDILSRVRNGRRDGGGARGGRAVPDSPVRRRSQMLDKSEGLPDLAEERAGEGEGEGKGIMDAKATTSDVLERVRARRAARMNTTSAN